MPAIGVPTSIRKISIDPDSPYYRPDFRNFIVFLNGENVPYVQFADVDQGYIIHTKSDESGQPIFVGNEWVMCKTQARVEIRQIVP
jgi:hypothetical protein